MSTREQTANQVFRDYKTDGVPSSGPHEPRKPEIRAYENLLNAAIDMALSGQVTAFLPHETAAALNADLAHAADAYAVVFADSTGANNGVYKKIGASGSGSWSQISSFVLGYVSPLALGSVSLVTDPSNIVVSITGPVTAPMLNLALFRGTKIWPMNNAAPSHAIGVDGDFAIDIATYAVYGPKTSGVWPAPITTAAAAAVAAQGSAATSASLANAAALSAAASESMAELVAAYASAAGIAGVFLSKSDADSGVAPFANGQFIEVLVDETHGDARTIYKKVAGSLSYQVTISQYLDNRYPIVLTPEQFASAMVDPTDWGPAFTAAYATAETTRDGAHSAVEISLKPGKSYRIKTPVTVKEYVAVAGNGAIIKGPIVGAEVISASNSPAVPAANDVAGQTAGACFIDGLTDGTVYGLKFKNLHVQGFRYGMCSTALSWTGPVFEDVFFENCNIGFFPYQGSMGAVFKRSQSGGPAGGTTFVGGATCFDATHPFKNRDNYFVDGLFYDSDGVRDESHRNPTFDAWFSAAVFRPGATSVTAGGNFVYPWSDEASVSVSGRNIFAPQRNNRGQYGWHIGSATATVGDFGFANIANPQFCSIANIGGELLFSAGPEAVLYVPLTGVGPLESEFRNIDATSVTNTASAAIQVVAAPGAPTSNFTGTRISGGIIGAEHFGALDPQAIDRYRGRYDAPICTLPLAAITSTTVSPSANKTYYFRLDRGGQVSNFGIHFVNSVGNFSLAIHRNIGTDVDAKPGAPLYLTGSQAVSVGFHQISMGATYTPREGDWVSVSFDNAGTQVVGMAFNLLDSGLCLGACGYESGFKTSSWTPNPAYGLAIVPAITLF
ncbi:hypothetical protein A1351_15555 [Methylosinus sp. R-45379]|uniref:hypothetical protein n=1 Tax=Methylosinus sp. R-45379 TaxID=980563 RepID=UPI0007C92C4A|nr:hypothetical protein [Methylosinus sp. R-45379]OAI25967.1 hypothetical protein A1351_15555 [Methylosinus sp. R-45379]